MDQSQSKKVQWRGIWSKFSNADAGGSETLAEITLSIIQRCRDNVIDELLESSTIVLNYLHPDAPIRANQRTRHRLFSSTPSFPACTAWRPPSRLEPRLLLTTTCRAPARPVTPDSALSSWFVPFHLVSLFFSLVPASPKTKFPFRAGKPVPGPFAPTPSTILNFLSSVICSLLCLGASFGHHSGLTDLSRPWTSLSVVPMLARTRGLCRSFNSSGSGA
jgi:hypothetical protein